MPLTSHTRESDIAPRLTSRVEAVFLDRDGVINENRADHVKSWAEFRFIPGSREAIARLTHAGVRVFVISNQAIVNRGQVPAAEVEAINRAMIAEIERSGGRIEGIAYCPHRPDEACACRKPRPGLLLQLAERHAIDLSAALVVGDAVSDLEAARAAGCPAMLVLTGRGRDQLSQASASGWAAVEVAADLSAIADVLSGPHDQPQPDLNLCTSRIEHGPAFNSQQGKSGESNA